MISLPGHVSPTGLQPFPPHLCFANLVCHHITLHKIDLFSCSQAHTHLREVCSGQRFGGTANSADFATSGSLKLYGGQAMIPCISAGTVH